MSNIETLTVRFEADAAPFFKSAEEIEQRLRSLRQGGAPVPLEMETRLTVAADSAIRRALEGAGETLAEAVRAHDISLGNALAGAERELADALRSAVRQAVSAITITVPVTVSGTAVSSAGARDTKVKTLLQGGS